MKYVDVLDNKIVLNDDNNQKVEIALEKITSLSSSVVVKYKRTKNLINILLFLGVLITILNFTSNMIERVVPDSEINTISYDQAYQRYNAQPGGYGTSIYNVHIGVDGNYYYSKNFILFFFIELIFVTILVTGVFFLIQEIKPVKKCFENNNHNISVYVKDFGSKTFDVGDFESTKNIFETIKLKYEKIKLG